MGLPYEQIVRARKLNGHIQSRMRAESIDEP